MPEALAERDREMPPSVQISRIEESQIKAVHDTPSRAFEMRTPPARMKMVILAEDRAPLAVAGGDHRLAQDGNPIGADPHFMAARQDPAP